MALVVKDRVKEITTTTGTGTYTLGGASTGFQSFSVIGNGNTTYYAVTDNINWEVGIGTYTSSGTTLSRDTILASSNGGSAVNWGAGTKDIFVTYPAERSITGPSTATDNAVVRFDTTDGTIVQGSGVTIDDSNNMTGVVALTATGNISFDGGTFVFNDSGADKDFRVEGDTDANLLFTDASTDRVGIGTSSPTQILDVNGNVAITGTGRRITGDFSNATIANRLMFQTSTTNGNTAIEAIPNGTAGATRWTGYNNSDPTNASFLQIGVNGTSAGIIECSRRGTGTFLPLAFIINDSERMRIDSSGNVGIGTAAVQGKFNVGSGRSFFGANSELYSIGVGYTQARVNSGQVYYLGASDSTTPDLVFSNSAGTERMRIANSGNVGIGTNNPTDKFQVNTQDGVRLGAASAVSYVKIGSAITGEGTAQISFDRAAGATIFSKGNTGSSLSEFMRLDSNGNVGIGTSAPAYKLDVNGDVAFTGTARRIIGDMTSTTHVNRLSFQTSVTNGITSPLFLPSGSGSIASVIVANASDPTNCSFGQLLVFGTSEVRLNSGVLGTGSFLPTTFYTGGTERMRIDASTGDLLVGTTSVPTNGASGYGSVTVAEYINVRGITSHAGINGAYQGNRYNIQWTGSAARLWVDITDLGSIQLSSDYRVKKDIQTQATDALSRIAKIRPVTYTYADYEPFSWKADGVLREGFIAHELAEVIPSAVEGEKDAPNQIQSLKVDALCSVLVKAIQEQQAIIEKLTQRIAALEGA